MYIYNKPSNRSIVQFCIRMALSVSENTRVNKSVDKIKFQFYLTVLLADLTT
jgi:hypothetical protein